MLTRVLEPEVMDTPEDARDYDAMDHSAVNDRFAADFLSAWGDAAGHVLDVGTGTAQIPIVVCQRAAGLTVTAVDAAAAMISLADENVRRAGLVGRVRPQLVNAHGLPYTDAAFDVVMSNSIVHHIPDPRGVLAEMVRVCRPGGLLFVRDLFRPPDEPTLAQLVKTYAGGANDHQRTLFADSLRAALTVDEVADLVAALGFDRAGVRATSDRHWTWSASVPG